MALEICKTFLNKTQEMTFLKRNEIDGLQVKSEKMGIAYEGKEKGGNIIIKLNEHQPNQHRIDIYLKPESKIEIKDLGLEIRAR